MTPHIEDAVASLFRLGDADLANSVATYQWVDTSGLTGWGDKRWLRPGESLRLPFDRVAMVAVDNDTRTLALMRQDQDAVELDVFMKGAHVGSGRVSRMADGRYYGLLDVEPRIRAVAGTASIGLTDEETATFFAGFVHRLIAAFDMAPVAAAKMLLHPKAASRIAQGRAPTYEWRTVVIEPRKPKTEYKGGTHASPRQHDRRGHWATSKRGKRFWRPPCKVGKASNGTVFHDYVVKGE